MSPRHSAKDDTTGPESATTTEGIGADYLPRILFCWPAAGRHVAVDIIQGPFTAADGKIPLSMVYVKLKPQYLVF